MTGSEPHDTTAFSERRVHRMLELEPDRTAVIVVDMLNDFLDAKGAMPLEGGDALYGPQRRVIDAARNIGSPVVWVCDEHPEDDLEFEKRSVHCLAGSWGAQIVPQLDPRPDEYRVAKRRYSGFFETDLDLRLRELDIRHLVVMGVVTNICVRSTVHDAFFRGYDVVVPPECVMATGEREQASTLYDIDTHFGTVTPLEDLIALLA
jgi:ureidoacrylate peracid hydrolase